MLPFLSAIELHNQVVEKPTSLAFYIFLGVALVLIYLKTSKTHFFRNLISTVSSDSTHFDPLLQTGSTNSGSVFMQLCFVLLAGLGVSALLQPELTVSGIIKGVFSVLGLYVFQLFALYIFSIINFSGDTDFLRKKLAYNEFNVLVLFVGLILVFYLPFYNVYLNSILFLLVWLLNMLGSSAYLLGNISIFHIILYLCILELIPVLFLIKYL